MNTSTSSSNATKKENWKTSYKKIPSASVRKALLVSGIVASIWYVVICFITPQYYPGYNSSSQVISELSAIDAPTRDLWSVLVVPFTLFLAVFGFGVLSAAGNNRYLLTAGVLLISYSLTGAFWPPMHKREVLAAGGGTLTDTLHIFFTMVTAALMTAAIVFAAKALGKWFRLYSMITILVFLLFGILTGIDAPYLESNQPTPWIGLWERINIYATMLWIMMFAIMLLRRENTDYLEEV